MKLAQLAEAIGAELVGDGSIEVTGVNSLDDAVAGQVTFLANPKYTPQLATTRASAAIVGPRVENQTVALLRTKDPHYAFARAVVALRGHRKHPHRGIHPRATVDPTASIGENTVVYPGVYVGPRAKIGRDCILYPNAVIYEDCILGDRVIVHANTVIGTDGYGYVPHDGAHYKIPQVGNVVIEDDVEINANCAIARAALGSTVIGRGSKLDTLVMVAHNVKIGEHCLLVAQVGISGSVTLGHHVTLAGQAGVAGHLKIGNNVIAGARTGIASDVHDGAVVMGTPAMPIHDCRRTYVLLPRLDEMWQKIRKLEKEKGE